MTSIRGRYFGWVKRHPEWDAVTLDAFTDIWRYSARTALVASSEFAGQISLMRELIWWLEAGEEAAAPEGSEDEQAARWALSNANAEEHAIREMDGELEELPF